MSKEAMKLALEEMKVGNYNSAAERLEVALAEQPAQQDEECPYCLGSRRMPRDPDIGTDQECFVCDGTGVVETEQPAQRKPLTDEEIDQMTRGNNYPGTVQGARRFTRAIEATHGIKGDA